jgi:S-DNA-T family DNA segregation ATPase FtsK/SpoIIIE
MRQGHPHERHPNRARRPALRPRPAPAPSRGPGSPRFAQVNELRNALRDDARRPAFLRTVHGFGYALADGPASGSASAPGDAAVVHRFIWGAGEISLPEGRWSIGRERTAGIWIADPSVSRRHALVEVRGTEVTVEDLDSKHRTYVDGALVDGRVPVRDGAEVRLGTVQLRLKTVSTDASTATVR